MDIGFVDWSSENVKEFIERDRTAVFPVVLVNNCALILVLKTHISLKLTFYVCALLDDKEYIALVVDCTICGFFRYFRSNEPEGGRTTARTNLTKNEFL